MPPYTLKWLLMKKSDSYILIKRGSHFWKTRLGFNIDDSWIPLECVSDDLEETILTLRNYANEQENMNTELLDFLNNELVLTTLIRKCRDLKAGFHLGFYKLVTEDVDCWFSIVATTEQIEEGSLNGGYADRLPEIALSECNVSGFCSRVKYSKGMQHTSNARTEDGRIVRTDYVTKRHVKRQREYEQRAEEWRDSPLFEQWEKGGRIYEARLKRKKKNDG